jgi:hypothetical protein
MIPCICINDSNRPSQIPIEKWVVKGDKYRISHIYYLPKQKQQGCDIYEKPLDESCAPYEMFLLYRFAISINDIPKLIELIKNCTDLNDLDIETLIEESQLEILEDY